MFALVISVISIFLVTALAIATLLITPAKIDETATEPHLHKHAQHEPNNVARHPTN